LICGVTQLLEYPRKLFGRNASSAVVHPHEDGVVLNRLEYQLYRAAARGELEGVREKVAEDLVDAVRVPEHFVGQARLALHTEVDLALHSQHVEGALQVGDEPVQ